MSKIPKKIKLEDMDPAEPGFNKAYIKEIEKITNQNIRNGITILNIKTGIRLADPTCSCGMRKELKNGRLICAICDG